MICVALNFHDVRRVLFFLFILYRNHYLVCVLFTWNVERAGAWPKLIEKYLVGGHDKRRIQNHKCRAHSANSHETAHFFGFDAL